MMSEENHRYILPGENDGQSSTVHRHGKILVLDRPFKPILRIYEPRVNDFVIGIVVVRTADLFVVDINSCESAILPIQSFDSGCLPKRHEMNRLSVVCARIINCDKWSQVELSCQTTANTSGKKFNLGHVNSGQLVRCSLNLCDKLAHSSLLHHLNQLDKTFHYRLARNGFLWYRTESLNSMIASQNILQNYEHENDINQLIETYKKTVNELEQNNSN